MLLEAQKRKIEAFQSMRSGELQEVQKLKFEIEKEKKDKLKVKKTEREAA
jgi:cold shock CspA family protein|tara:strand:- start:881 stop:1030 length:150 start_codon:yes stop_codon:yes gene_type:complete